MASIPLHDITFDGLDNVYTIPQAASELVNDSSNVTGSTVADALDNLNTKIGTDLGALGSDDIVNDSSSVSGTSVTNAIDNLQDAIDGIDSAVSGLTASQISNNSTVTGTKVSDALDTLSNTVGGLAGSDIANDAANVSGTSVSDALDTLDAAIDALGSDDIANESDVTGTNVSDALDALDGKIDALGSDDIANDSEYVVGDNVTEALEDHDERVSMFEGAVKSVSGGIASFNASVADIPLRSLTVDINPIQSGSGDPSPSNIRPISGWTGATIKRIRKNLLDPQYSVLYSNNVKPYENNGFTLRAGQPYTFSVNETASGLYISELGSESSVARAYNTSSLTYTPTEDIVVFFNAYYSTKPAGGTNSLKLQLEFGSTATGYEPYQESTFDITFPTAAGTVYGGTLDVTSGVLVVNKYVRTITNMSDIQGDSSPYYIGNWSAYSDDPSDPLNVISDKVPTASSQGSDGIYINSNKAIMLKIPTSDYATKEDFITALNGSLTICYKLETPFSYTLTPLEIKTLLGVNNIWSECGDTMAVYGNYLNAAMEVADKNLANEVYDYKNGTTVTGDIVTFESEVADLPLEECIVHIEPKQDFNGYSKPWIGGSGKNLLPVTLDTMKAIFYNGVGTGSWNGNTYTHCGITWTANNDGTILVNGTASGGNSTLWFFSNDALGFTFDLPSGTYTLSRDTTAEVRVLLYEPEYANGMTLVSNSHGTFEVNETRHFTSGYFQVTNGTTITNVLLKPQLELGSAVTDFEPYVNICPIEGFDKATIYSYGKNIFNYRRANLDRNSTHNFDTVKVEIDENGAEEGTLRVHGAYSYEWNNAQIDVYFPEPGIYTISADVIANTNGAAIGINNDSAANRVSNEHMRLSPGSLGKVYSTYNIPTAGYWFISLWCCNGSASVQGNSTFTNIQVEKGSEATTYEPYDQITINLQTEAGTVYGGTLDVLTGELVADKRLISLKISDLNGTSEDYAGWRGISNYSEIAQGNDFIFNNVLSNIGGTITGYTPGSSIGINKRYFGLTQTEWKTKYPDLVVEILCPLNSPHVYQLTPQEIKTLLGANNLWCDAGNLTVTYGNYFKAGLNNTDNAVKDIKQSTALSSTSIATFNSDVANVPLKSCKVHIEPKQDLRGFNHPWIAGGGKKNLFPLPPNASATNAGLKYTINPDGSILVVGTVSGSDAYYVLHDLTTISDYFPVGKYVLVGDPSYSSAGVRAVLSIRRANDTTQYYEATSASNVIFEIKSDDQMMGLYFRGGTNNTSVNVIIHPMIVAQGTTDFTFEPYENICPITGYDAVNVCNIKDFLQFRNPVDNLAFSNGIYWHADGKSVYFDGTSLATSYSGVIGSPVGGQTLPAGRYKIHAVGIEQCPANVNFQFTINNGSATTLTAANPSAIIEQPSSFALSWYLMIASGVTVSHGIVTPVIEHVSNYITFPSSTGTVYSGTLDVINGTLVVDKATYTCTGNENWTQSSNAQTPSNSVRWDSRIEYAPIAHEILEVTNSHFPVAIEANNVDQNAGGIWVNPARANASALEIRISSPKFQAWSSLVNYLRDQASKGTPVQFTYTLETPITYHLTPQEVKCVLGQNNIWSNAGDVEVEHGAYLETISEYVTKLNRAKAGSKNLIPFPYLDATKTVNGLTFTNNQDGSISISGTATDWSYFTLCDGIDFGNVDMYSTSTNNSNYKAILTNGTSDIFIVYYYSSKKTYIAVRPNTIVHSVIVYPMICLKGETGDENFELYEKSNQELTKDIADIDNYKDKDVIPFGLVLLGAVNAAQTGVAAWLYTPKKMITSTGSLGRSALVCQWVRGDGKTRANPTITNAYPESENTIHVEIDVSSDNSADRFASFSPVCVYLTGYLVYRTNQ